MTLDTVLYASKLVTRCLQTPKPKRLVPSSKPIHSEKKESLDTLLQKTIAMLLVVLLYSIFFDSPLASQTSNGILKISGAMYTDGIEYQ